MLLDDGGRYHIETSPLIYRVNQWSGFYMISASVMKELKEHIKVNISQYKQCGVAPHFSIEKNSIENLLKKILRKAF